jgi:hypothetical protein
MRCHRQRSLLCQTVNKGARFQSHLIDLECRSIFISRFGFTISAHPLLLKGDESLRGSCSRVSSIGTHSRQDVLSIRKMLRLLPCQTASALAAGKRERERVVEVGAESEANRAFGALGLAVIPQPSICSGLGVSVLLETAATVDLARRARTTIDTASLGSAGVDCPSRTRIDLAPSALVLSPLAR